MIDQDGGEDQTLRLSQKASGMVVPHIDSDQERAPPRQGRIASAVGAVALEHPVRDGG